MGVVLLNAATIKFGVRRVSVIIFPVGVDHAGALSRSEKTVLQAFVIDLPDKLHGV
jgi:hypothetical protein